MWGIYSPSEGGMRVWKEKAGSQTLQGNSGKCTPSEGETKTRGIYSPSEGGRKLREKGITPRAETEKRTATAPPEKIFS